MRILVVCGAGASSTFVAQRVRSAAEDRGIPCEARAGSESSIGADLDTLDVVLVGPHLAPRMELIRAGAASRGAVAVLLPGDVFSDLDGSRTLALVQESIASSRITAPTQREDHDD
ncbi:PTS sugar transporter subunit IIB [Microbacterium rhizosphaerae]|jgi:PTS system cellobiose-specific IIB component|uniref:PTS sugar transporter n=1 Tax=Microbacterium rhizosphaerae TaxID=1678237 RepID=A0ABZ0SRJ5_9MICO|nr:PTS sugar transporter [Microbacterium rhizosphaerae]WPR90785.1 PTS sugar transporter [Microbacterium rhizosphaerae]